MPFGLVFGAVFFASLAFRAAALLPPGSGTAGRPVALIVGWIGLALATGLLLRQSWARWAGAAFALLLTLAGSLLVAVRGEAVDFVVFLGALTTLVLLLVSPTGDPRRGLSPEARPWRRTGRVLGWLTLCGFVVLAAAAVPAVRRLPNPPPGGQPGDEAARAAPAAASVEWLDYGPGLLRAKATGKPVFIDFYASWCGPCKMMERRTFRDAEVSRRLSEIVAVRVDSEETKARAGERGVDIAERFNVKGYPTLVVLDPAGREVSRRSGFIPPDEFAEWLTRSVERAETRSKAAAQLRS